LGATWDGRGTNFALFSGNATKVELCLFDSHGRRELEQTVRCELLQGTSKKAQANLHRALQHTLEWITRPCLELEWTSYTMAMEALRLGKMDPSVTRQKFLGKQPRRRLFALFKRFPVLAALWSTAINQWRSHVVEILERAARDERAIARAFFGSAAGGRIKDVRLGLSDRHRGGRSVALVEFENGRVIYKPRSGTSEAEWASLLRWMNEHGFEPRLKEARSLRRKNYHWMENIEPGTCRDVAAVRRFFERLGGLIAAAYLLNAVDCHRENLMASGEEPVLVDIDALWHVSSGTRAQSAETLLYRTGFFPDADRASLQSRSSILGKTRTGTHLPRIGARCESAADYSDQIIQGFEKGWNCLLGKPRNRAVFLRRRRRIRAQQRRWIYRATASYAAIIRASLQPSALTSPKARHDLVRRLSARKRGAAAILKAEMQALQQLDIPYFVRRADKKMGFVTASPPVALARAIRQALATGKIRRKRR
jgi:lantibiotic modifying enzyme